MAAKDLSFALLREGTSDDGLVVHIRRFIVECGASSATGAPYSLKGSTAQKLRQLTSEFPGVDLIFVHRDSDSRDAEPRYVEIGQASETLGISDRVVSIVPVQEIEAWLLADEQAIRAVVGKPSGKAALKLPPVRNIEATNSPREILRQACLDASESSGARLRKHATSFTQYRRTLLERLDPAGPVSELPSWKRFLNDVREAVENSLQKGDPTSNDPGPIE